VGLDFEAWMRLRRREEVGERGANMTDLLCERWSSGSWGEMEREDGGVRVCAGDGGEGW
jgi:hypothetical protein